MPFRDGEKIGCLINRIGRFRAVGAVIHVRADVGNARYARVQRGVRTVMLPA